MFSCCLKLHVEILRVTDIMSGQSLRIKIKLRSFKSSEHINEKNDGHAFGKKCYCLTKKSVFLFQGRIQ